MNNFDYSSLNSARAVSNAYDAMRQHEREQERKDAQRIAPVADGINGIVAQLQDHNKILQAQVEEAQRESEEAKKDARRANILAWVSFGVSTFIALASLLVSIIK